MKKFLVSQGSEDDREQSETIGAERAGNCTPAFRNPSATAGLRDNHQSGCELGPASPSPSVPVVPGRGGSTTGRNRDSSPPSDSRPSRPFWAAVLGLALAAVAAAHPSGSRATAHVADERQAQWDRTWEEIRHIVAEFHPLLPPDRAAAVGAAYARYSSRHQDSVADQVRAIYADAVRKGVFIPLDHVFLDLAVRGVKNDRPGLNALRTLLNRRAAQVVFFFATNRLFRKTYRSLQFVEEQVVEKGVRAVFVKSGVDTADGKRWRGLLSMHAMMDEFVVGMTADHIRAAHEGLLDKRLVFGTISFGYAGRPLDGQTTRRGQPRLALVVDDVTGGWVRRVYEGYVVDRVPIAEIVRRLRADPAVPPPPRSPTRTWTRDAVRRLLANPRYRGCWRYGVTGGRIELEQAGERRAQGGWLRGRFRCPLIVVVSAGRGGRPVGAGDAPWVEVDYRADRGPDPSLAREVNERYDAGRLIGQIADELRLPHSVVTAALDARFAAEGWERPDGRTRRATLPDKHVERPVYQAVADRIKELADRGLLFGRIASELGLDRNTITAAWRYWHESRGLPVPDGRTRWKELAVKTTGSEFRVPVGADQPADTGDC